MRRNGQKAPDVYHLPRLAEFFKSRRSESDSEREEVVGPGRFRFCLVKFIELLTEFSAGQPGHLELRY